MNVSQPGVAEDLLGALLNAAVDAIAAINHHGEITCFNHAAERNFGWRMTEVLGKNVSMLMPEPYRSEHDDYLRRFYATGQARIIGIGREVVAQRKDGSVFPINLAVGEFRFGTEHGFIAILRDITEQRRQEEVEAHTAREAEELRSRLAHVGRVSVLGEMVSGIAHEVNQPLTAIANYANACQRLLTTGQTSPEEIAQVLEKIAVQAERAGQVIRGLRSFIRKRDAVREVLDCNLLVREVVKLVEFDVRQRGCTLILNLAEKLPPALGDGVQIQQVILNLIRNGLDAMQQQAHGNVIEVITHAPEPGWMEIAVSDVGHGIPPEVAARLYEPFFTTKPEGIGLGLSICQSIIAAHGGEMDHHRNPVQGTTFTVRLPALT